MLVAYAPSTPVMGYLQRYGLAAAIAVLYLYSFPYFPKIRHANELPRVYLTQAMVHEGRLAIDTGVARWGSTADVSPANGHFYSNKAPGASMLAAPAYALVVGVRSVLGMDRPSLAQATWVSRVVTGVIPTLLFLLLMWRFLERWAPRRDTRRLLVVAYALGTMAMPYSILFHSHQLAAVLIATAFIFAVWVVEDGRDIRWMWVVGLAAGASPLVDYQAAFAGVPIAIYLIAGCIRMRRGWRPIAYAAVGSIPPMALLLAYHKLAFGGFFKTGYEASETFAFHHQKGFLGMDQLRWEAFTGSTVSADHGLLFFCPMLLLAFAGWFLMARGRQHGQHGQRGQHAPRRDLRMLAVTVSVAIIYVAFQSSINFWRAGWSLGPRYITAMLPFLMVPIAVAADLADRACDRHAWWYRGVVAGLMLVGIAVYALSSAEYPHFPEKFGNPFFEVTTRLIVDGRAPYNIGFALGLRGLASLVPYLLVLCAVVVAVVIPDRRRLASGALAFVIAGATLVAYSKVPGGRRSETFRAYQCYVAGVMPDRPPAGHNGGSCRPKGGCDRGLICLTCDREQRLCVSPTRDGEK